MPGYDALNDLMNKIDPAAYAAALTRWLQQHQGYLPQSLALDGKIIGDGNCGLIAEKGGDYLVGTKDNTSKRLAACRQSLAPGGEAPPF